MRRPPDLFCARFTPCKNSAVKEHTFPSCSASLTMCDRAADGVAMDLLDCCSLDHPPCHSWARSKSLVAVHRLLAAAARPVFFSFVLFFLVLFCFVSFRFVSFRFVSFCFVLFLFPFPQQKFIFRVRFSSHFRFPRSVLKSVFPRLFCVLSLFPFSDRVLCALLFAPCFA